MKLIELFIWNYEGEYQQYFYAVEDEEAFIKEVLKYLNEVVINTDFPWSDCLIHFKEEQEVEPYFLPGVISHLNEYYYMQYDEVKFTLEKHTNTVKVEEIK